MSKPISIDIVIDNAGIYASRLWRHVPRQHDLIQLTGEREGLYLITHVVWHGKEKPRVALQVTNAK